MNQHACLNTPITENPRERILNRKIMSAKKLSPEKNAVPFLTDRESLLKKLILNNEQAGSDTIRHLQNSKVFVKEKILNPKL